MTSVFKPHDAKGLLYRENETVWLAYNKETEEILQYDTGKHNFKVDLEHFTENSTIEVKK
jgi:hypothetical protein